MYDWRAFVLISNFVTACSIYVYIKTSFNIILNIMNINKNCFQLESRKTGYQKEFRIDMVLFHVQFKWELNLPYVLWWVERNNAEILGLIMRKKG